MSGYNEERMSILFDKASALVSGEGVFCRMPPPPLFSWLRGHRPKTLHRLFLLKIVDNQYPWPGDWPSIERDFQLMENLDLFRQEFPREWMEVGDFIKYLYEYNH